MRTHVDAGRKVVRLVLGPSPYQSGLLGGRMDVIRDPRTEVEDLREAAQTLMGRCVLDAHDEFGCFPNRLREVDQGALACPDGADPLVIGSDRVVGTGGRGEPALAHEAPFAKIILLGVQSKAPSGREPVPGHEGRVEPQDPVLFLESPFKSTPEGLLDLVLHSDLLHAFCISTGTMRRP